MSSLKFINKKNELSEEEVEEYEIIAFKPLDVPMTDDLVRRQSVEDLRNKYCKPLKKSAELI